MRYETYMDDNKKKKASPGNDANRKKKKNNTKSLRNRFTATDLGRNDKRESNTLMMKSSRKKEIYIQKNYVRYTHMRNKI